MSHIDDKRILLFTYTLHLFAGCVESQTKFLDETTDPTIDRGQSMQEQRDWVGVWGGPRTRIDSYFAAHAYEQSLRLIISPTLGGETVRLGFSNMYGSRSVTIGSVKIALSNFIVGDNGSWREVTATVQSETNTPVRFAGRATVTIPVSEDVVSDPIRFEFAFGDNLAVSFYVVGENNAPTITRRCFGSFSTPANSGNRTDDDTGDSFTEANIFGFGCPYLNRLDVFRPNTPGTVVVLGDSIVEGAFRADEGPFDSWPWLMAERLNAAGILMGVINMGLSGNMITTLSETSTNMAVLLEAAPIRFDRDVISQTNVRTVIISMGINDLRVSEMNPEAIIDGLQQMVDKAHRVGLRVLIATIPPGALDGCSPGGDDKRRRVNDWIRNHTSIEGWLPFDETLRDPDDIDSIMEEYDTDGDNIHPDIVGKRAMANAVPLELL
ncbi:MAG: hypothetical protein JXA30_09075 [Deltaproteobacteria bacterium]|nr:hypothetical protein [Deltaproteobacteria bacterium]